VRELRLLRQDADHGNLIFKAADSEDQFVLHVDEMVRAAVRFEVPHSVPRAGEAARPAPAPVAAEPAIPVSPREIQMRVRAGDSPQTVASEYGIPVERVLRFAAAVVEERARIADEARRARARRPSGEGQPVVFGETVDERYAAHGIAASTVGWDAYRREDGEWIVVARWRGGEGEHTAEWVFHRTSRTVTPVDDAASDLLSDRPIRPVRPATESRPALSVAPPLAPGVVAFPPMPDARTGPVPVLDDVFDQESTIDQPRDVPPLQPVPAAVPAAVPPAATVQAAEFDAPPLPLGIVEPLRVPNLAVTRREETDEERAARARIPSWDDILLGVRRKSD
jgi:hypothetical protein